MTRRIMISGLVVALATSGCLMATTVGEDQPRVAVRFESPNGAQAFYDAYIVKFHTQRLGAGFCLGVPYPFQYKVLVPENANFNAAVKAADVNGDGVISDVEARRYVEWVKPSTAPTGLFAVAKG